MLISYSFSCFSFHIQNEIPQDKKSTRFSTMFHDRKLNKDPIDPMEKSSFHPISNTIFIPDLSSKGGGREGGLQKLGQNTKFFLHPGSSTSRSGKSKYSWNPSKSGTNVSVNAPWFHPKCLKHLLNRSITKKKISLSLYPLTSPPPLILTQALSPVPNPR